MRRIVMRLVYEGEGQTGKFVVTETSDKEIIKQFIDYETGYLIVMEENKIDLSDRWTYYTVIEPDTGKIIKPQERKRQIDTEEQITIDEENGWKIITQRIINEKTGGESIHQKLIDISTEKEVMSKRGIAFRPNRRETIVESHNKYEKERMAEDQIRQKFWNEEYPNKTLEDKQLFWADYIYRQMRMLGDSGQDEYNVFKIASYVEWKEKEPQIDLMLDFVARRLPLDRDEYEVRAIINQSLDLEI